MKEQKYVENQKPSWSSINLNVSDSSNFPAIEAVCRALGSQKRLDILNQLHEKPCTIVEIAKNNCCTNATAMFHLDLLEKAQLIRSQYIPSKKGRALVYFLSFEKVLFSRDVAVSQTKKRVFEQSMPVGMYTDVTDIDFVSYAKSEYEGNALKSGLFDPNRLDAGIIWSFGGQITYTFSNFFDDADKTPEELRFSLELCSEISFYRNDWKSEITFWINGVEVATYLSPGDFGGTRGKLNPDWWGDNNTQYGLLVTLSVRKDGTYLNDKLASPVTVDELKLNEGNKILFRLGNKKDATYYGGFNLFGKTFGNYEQDIIMTATVE